MKRNSTRHTAGKSGKEAVWMMKGMMTTIMRLVAEGQQSSNKSAASLGTFFKILPGAAMPPGYRVCTVIEQLDWEYINRDRELYMNSNIA